MRIDQIKYLRSLPNASAFLRSLIDETMGKKVLVEKPKPKTELTLIEEKLILSLIEKYDQTCDWSFNGGYFEYKKPYRYAVFQDLIVDRNSFLEWLKENEKIEELEYLLSFPADVFQKKCTIYMRKRKFDG